MSISPLSVYTKTTLAGKLYFLYDYIHIQKYFFEYSTYSAIVQRQSKLASKRKRAASRYSATYHYLRTNIDSAIAQR